MRIFFIVLGSLLFTSTLLAQEAQKIQFDGNFRLSYTGAGLDNGFEDGITALRTRIGAKYAIDNTHSFRGRLAVTFSDEIETPVFTLRADGAGLNLGSISFDELYYRFQNEDFDIKLGRFQHTISVLSNAKRSLMRFHSANVSIHWSDGIYAKKNLNDGWYTEFIGELQPRNHTTYPYQGNLDFGNNEQNITTYLALENRNRDSKNIIQKGVGIFVAPNAYDKNGEYSSYIAFTSRIALDFPQPDLLQNGSFRIAGELGQNLSTGIQDGTIAIASIGVNNVADKHEFMIEFASTDREWLLANAYARGGEEVEFRYRIFINKNLNFDTRYRVRSSKINNAPNIHGAFLRLNYSF